MAAVVSGITHLVESFLEIIQGIVTTVFQAIAGVINASLGALKGVFGLAEGVLGFIIGNLFIIGTLAALYFGYILYQQRQGQRGPVSKKLN